MSNQATLDVTIRDARPSDLPGLSAIFYSDHPAIHRDRLQDADGQHVRYLVAEVGGTVAGFALLVLKRPAHWPDAVSVEYLPGLWDLYVAEAWRGQGIGTRIIQHSEKLTACAGHNRLYLSVDPIENKRAYEFYLRLGYAPVHPEPVRDPWSFVDSEGFLHQGDEWSLQMAKVLSITSGEEEP